MKKAFSALLVLILCSFAVSSVAEKRNAFEFCDLYSSRLAQLKQDYGQDATHGNCESYLYDNTSMKYMNVFAGKDRYYASLPVGTALISVPNFDIEELSVTLLNNKASRQQQTVDSFRVVAMLSALEYDSIKDSELQMMSIVKPSDPANALIKSMDIVSNTIYAYLNNARNLTNVKQSKSDTLVYKGDNYSYYIRYYASSDGAYNQMLLIARPNTVLQ